MFIYCNLYIFSSLLLCCASANYDISVIYYNCLSACYRTLRNIESNLQCIRIGLHYDCRLLRLTVSNFNL